MYRKFLLPNLVLFSFLFNLSLLAQDDDWTTKSPMPTPRYSHGTCAVNGKIYAIGGETTGNGCNSPATQKVEKYNPSTDSWNTTNTDMPMARESFGISEVNGKIYVIGGSPITCSNHTSTVQEYDPQTDTWDTTKTPMPTPRSGLSASVVNGKIYAIGGYRYNPYEPLNNVEEYDPVNDSWTPKTGMNTARGWFSTCVVDGKIYAFGGHDAVLNVEVYDPITDSWTPKANMPDSLTIYSASTVNGKIYIFGGVKKFTLNGPDPVSNVWEYNTISDTYSPMSPMLTARAATHASEVNGKIYVIGGSTTNHHVQPGNKVEEYTPPPLQPIDTWTAKTDMPTSRYGHNTCAVNGKIYAIGGVAGIGCYQPAFPTVEEYNPSTDTWDTTKTDMPTARTGFALSAVNGKIYAIGGSSQTCVMDLSTVEVYDPQTNTWDDTTKTDMPSPRGGLSSSAVNGKIYAIGGHYNGNALRTVEEYDPVTNNWTPKADMPVSLYFFSTCVVNGKIYAFWEYYGNPDETAIYIYDPATDTWDTKNTPIQFGACSASSVNGLIYIFGGRPFPGSEPVSDVWEYNPVSDSWRSVSSMPDSIASDVSSVVNGRIYASGGSTTLWPYQPVSTVFEYTPPPPDSSVKGLEDPSRGDKNPAQFMLHQNYPNPFNPSTTIEFSLPKSDFVTLKIYNLLGQEVEELVAKRLTPGNYKYTWDASDLSSGVYYYKIQTSDGFVQSKKLIVLK
jgi:N-acetylneuraminic acid mutarotase